MQHHIECSQVAVSIGYIAEQFSAAISKRRCGAGTAFAKEGDFGVGMVSFELLEGLQRKFRPFFVVQSADDRDPGSGSSQPKLLARCLSIKARLSKFVRIDNIGNHRTHTRVTGKLFADGGGYPSKAYLFGKKPTLQTT